MEYTDIFDYNAESGVLSWKEKEMGFFKRRCDFLTWNKRFAGKEGGCVNGDGYRVIRLRRSADEQGKMFQVHRIIWEMLNGPIPDGLLVDHADGDKLNNRPYNLRLATNQENHSNKRRNNRKSSSGFRGVYPKPNGKWEAKIGHKSKLIYLGVFDNPLAASEAYKTAAVDLRKSFTSPSIFHT